MGIDKIPVRQKKQPGEAPKEIMDVKELADYLGIGKSKIYSLIRHRRIPASKIGRQYRFSKTVVDNWLKEKIITEKQELQTNLFDKKA